MWSGGGALWGCRRPSQCVKGGSLPYVSEIEMVAKREDGGAIGERREIPGKTLLDDGRTFRPAKATREHMDLQLEGPLNASIGLPDRPNYPTRRREFLSSQRPAQVRPFSVGWSETRRDRVTPPVSALRSRSASNQRIGPRSQVQTIETRQVRGTTYYISAAGSDSNVGTSSSKPWRTVGRLNAIQRFGPGTRILFRGGDTFVGGLDIQVIGTPASPVTIGTYGSGKATLTDFPPYTDSIVQLTNSEYVTVQNSEVHRDAGPRHGTTNFAPLNTSYGFYVVSYRSTGHRLQSIHVTRGRVPGHPVRCFLRCQHGPGGPRVQ